jgi:hypothetical protein
MTLHEVLQELIERLGAAGDTLLAWEQVREWPKGAIEIFQVAGWIAPREAATKVECSGCEESCFVSVHVRPAQNQQPASAYVACDRRAEMGRVKIALSRLRQWQITDAQIAHWLTGTFGLKGKPVRDPSSGVFTIGTLQGKKRLGALQFDTTSPVSLNVAGHSIPLCDVVNFEQDRLGVDRATILGMVDLLPVAEAKDRYLPSTARRDARKLDTQMQYQAWQKAYRALKRKRSGMSDVWYAQQIAKTDNPNKRSADTIREHMKK